MIDLIERGFAQRPGQGWQTSIDIGIAFIFLSTIQLLLDAGHRGLGNAGGLAFRVNDRPGVPLGKSGEVKRNIVITRDNIPSLVQQDASSVQASHSS